MRSTALFIALLALLVTGLMAQDNAEGKCTFLPIYVFKLFIRSNEMIDVNI
jgi:hypothetical protein